MSSELITPAAEPTSYGAAPDQVRRFILENHPVRGHWVRLDEAWRAVREHKDYPAPVRDLLGQAMCASVLIAATLKFRGTLTLQLQGNGAVHLLVAQCTHDFHIRAVARYHDTLKEATASSASDIAQDDHEDNEFRRLVGDEGRVIVTVEASESDMRYQGIVPLTGNSFAECLETYFASSEQLPTRVRLATDETRAAGLLIQKLPSADEEDYGFEDEEGGAAAQSAWRDAQRGVATIKAGDLLRFSVEKLLTEHLEQRDVRLFKAQPVHFECRCSPQRVGEILRALGADEVREVLKEQGSVTVTCDFCDRPYRFDADEVERLFSPSYFPSGPDSLQ